jgi:hypothetical protein
MRRHVRATTAAALLAALLGSTTAGAQAPPHNEAQTDLGSTGDRPWAKGVPQAEQRLATELFREGNNLLKESLFVAAAEKYREALGHWNHPGVHYNLALALLNLDQPVEVFNHLEEAMKYGPTPLDADKFEHAGRYKALIEKQLARVEVSCGEPGAQVTMDGRPLFTAPGRYEALVRVGQHSILAEKTGFVTTQKTPMLPPGKKTTVELKLYTADDLTRYKRRWPAAMPWLVLGAGVLLAGVGGIMHWQAVESFAAYDAGITACARGGMSGGCVPDEGLVGKKSQGEALQAAAISSYAIGGAVVVVGGVLAYLNRARPYRVTPEADRVAWRPSLLPLFGPRGGGAALTFHF